MKTNTFKAVTLYFYLLLFCSCGLLINKDCFDNNNYKFNLPFTLYPTQDTFHINDTIWLHADFSDMLYDSNSLNYYKVENEYFESMFMFTLIDTVPELLANQDFYTVVDTGELYYHQFPTVSSFDYNFLYTHNRYKLHVGFIPTRKGLYRLHQLAIAYQEVDFQKKCPGEIMNVYFTLNNGSENNYHLLALSPDTYVHNMSQTQFNGQGSYAFYVVD